MGVLTELPHRVRTIDHIWIPLADGTRLAARIWLPEERRARSGAGDPRVPPLPQGRRVRRARRATHHAYFAGHGYAGVRVDLRGSGDSDGILEDEYLPQEQDDALEVIEWLAAQPWCSGSVGHDRHLLGRLQRPAGRGAAAAGAARRSISMCSTRRPLRRRRALRRRLRARRGHAPVGGDDAHAHGDAARPGGGRRRLARDVAGRGCERDAGDRRGVAGAPAPRRLLAPGLGVRGLRRDRGRRVRGRRLGRRLHERGPAADRGAARPEEGADRPVVAHVPPRRAARAGDRLPAGVPALVGPLAEGRRHRRHGRARAARLDAGRRLRPPTITSSGPGAG